MRSVVLAGAALGHFLAAFFSEAFPVTAEQSRDLTLHLGRKEISVSFRWAARGF